VFESLRIEGQIGGLGGQSFQPPKAIGGVPHPPENFAIIFQNNAFLIIF